MRSILTVLAASAVLGAAATAVAIDPGCSTCGNCQGSGFAAPPCGAPGRPACPMQRWMRNRVAVPYATRNLAKLAAALEQLTEFNPRPDKWHNWRRFCAQGAAAARDGRKDRAVRGCTHCHRVYRPAYNRAHRTRPIGAAR